MALSKKKLFQLSDALFEWDTAKAATNVRKHGVTFEEAASVFGDDHAMLIDDPEHSAEEERFLLLGYSINRRILSVVHVERAARWRIISARPATKGERSEYEEGQN